MHDPISEKNLHILNILEESVLTIANNTCVETFMIHVHIVNNMSVRISSSGALIIAKYFISITLLAAFN